MIGTEVFQGGGAPYLSCQCGRTHIAGNHPQRDQLLEGRHGRYLPVVHDDCDSVTARMIGGQVLVDGCECGSLDRFCELLLAERAQILRFYAAHAEAARRTADEQAAALMQMAGAA